MVYWSFLEFGIHLSNDDAWVPMLAEPAVAIKLVSAGMSQVFAVLLKAFFGGYSAFDISTGGLQLEGPHGDKVRIWAVLSMTLQDGAAQKAVWGCKGDGGSKHCMLCRNLYSGSSGIAASDATHMLVDDMVGDSIEFSTNADIMGVIDRLKHHKATCSIGDFKLREQACGFSLQEHGLLSDAFLKRHLRPADQFCHDWMHGVMANGVFHVTLLKVIEMFRGVAPSAWSNLAEYTNRYTWPAQTFFQPGAADMFSDDKVKAYRKAGHVKCTASQALAIYPVIAAYVRHVVMKVPGVCAHACQAYLHLTDLLDALVVVPHGLTTSESLRSTVRSLMQACKHVRNLCHARVAHIRATTRFSMRMAA